MDVSEESDREGGLVIKYTVNMVTIRVRLPAEAGMFLLVTPSRFAPASTHSPIQWVLRALFLKVKRAEHETHHLRLRGAIPPPSYMSSSYGI
jgi:hypothetical protein